MTKEEIIEMAQQCGLIGMRPHLDGIYSESLEAFAKLIAKHERKDIWDMIKKYGDGLPSNDIKVTCMYFCDHINERNFK